MIIRKFEPSDFPGIMEIERRVFDEHNPYYYMQFYETCSDGFIVAELNGIVVGYIVGFQSSERTGRIFSFAVHPDYQNLGIGSNLLKEMIHIFSMTGVLEVTLEVRLSNTRARRFYEKYGFYPIRILKRYYNDGEDAYLMKLKIHTNT